MLIHIVTLSWFVINASYVIGKKIAKPRQKPIFTDRGLPQFFYELVQYWVAFNLVKIFSKQADRGYAAEEFFWGGRGCLV
jgi:hypothetical protein